MRRWLILIVAGAALATQSAQDRPGRRGGPRPAVQSSKCNDVPAHPFDLILGRPTSNSVTVSVLCQADAKGYIAYGTEPDKLQRRTPPRLMEKGHPEEFVLSGLRSNTRFFYQFRFVSGGIPGVATNITGIGTNSAVLCFHTARPRGEPFTFTVTADSHLDERTDPLVYQRTLAGALKDEPDFHIDLGDTFMTEKHPGRDEAHRQYIAQRYYFGQMSASTPLFLVLGNHDGESPGGGRAGGDSLAVWSNTMRKRYFPNPAPDGFYTGNRTPHPQAGLLQDYYAWEWGDALFVVLDPFWFTPKQRWEGDNWNRTLGAGQHAWLGRTLESSKARFKFVFVHHLVGGFENQCRGGSEAAPFFEWGGKNADGSEGFKEHRPGWAAPIHQMLVTNKVKVVFHGHDHFYARQALDGVIYQEVPQPGFPGNGRPPRNAAEYGYREGTILGSPGYLRVRVFPKMTMVSLARPAGSGAEAPHAYEVSP